MAAATPPAQQPEPLPPGAAGDGGGDAAGAGASDVAQEVASFESEHRCECGNIYMPDAVFCRKCGVRRHEDCGPRVGSPVWTWSGQNYSKRRAWTAAWYSSEARRGAQDKAEHRFRFLDRNGPFGQSLGQWNVHRVASRNAREIQRLYLLDSYHSFIDGGGIWVQLMIYSAIYVSCFLVFAVFYLLISDACQLGIDGKFVRAYYLALESMVTIGFGAPDPYYDNCWEGTVLLTVQSILAYFLHALVIGSVFVRLTRPQPRAATILFSDKAVIREINGACYFMFQVCEAKHHDLLEAHVRCYCIRHDRKGEQTYSILPLRLQQPDDDKGGALILTLPTKVVHRIDNWSPLSPACDSARRRRGSSTSSRRDLTASGCPGAFQRPFWAYGWPEVPQRQADADQGGADTCACPVCGGSFQSFEQLRRHTEYMAAQDVQAGLPAESRHVAWSESEMRSWGWSIVERPSAAAPSAGGARWSVSSAEVSRTEIEEFLLERYVEVVVLVEGMEPTTSSTVQARHSYLFPSDVMWDRDFEDCTMVGKCTPCAVDLTRFHDLVPTYEADFSRTASPSEPPCPEPPKGDPKHGQERIKL